MGATNAVRLNEANFSVKINLPPGQARPPGITQDHLGPLHLPVSLELSALHLLANLLANRPELRVPLDQQINDVVIEWKHGKLHLVLELEHKPIWPQPRVSRRSVSSDHVVSFAKYPPGLFHARAKLRQARRAVIRDPHARNGMSILFVIVILLLLLLPILLFPSSLFRQ